MPCSSQCIEKGCCEVVSESKLAHRFICHRACPHHRVMALHSPLQSLPHYPLQVPPSLASCPLPAWHVQDALAMAHCAWMGQVGLGWSGCQILLPPTVGSCVMNAGVLPCVRACVLVPSFADLSPHLHASPLICAPPPCCAPSPHLHAAPSFACHPLVCTPSPHLHAIPSFVCCDPSPHSYAIPSFTPHLLVCTPAPHSHVVTHPLIHMPSPRSCPISSFARWPLIRVPAPRSHTGPLFVHHPPRWGNELYAQCPHMHLDPSLTMSHDVDNEVLLMAPGG